MQAFDYNGACRPFDLTAGIAMVIPQPVIAAVIIPFVMWRVYMRIRRLMVRQKSQAWRHWIGVVLFPLLSIVLGTLALAHPLSLAGMAGGAAIGVALGVVGLRRTMYESIGGEFFYTPSAHIGVLVSMLFLGRLLYRGYEFYVAGAARPDDFASSPLTLLVFGILAGYYTSYAAGILRWRRRAT
jgi:hypothetical protein